MPEPHGGRSSGESPRRSWVDPDSPRTSTCSCCSNASNGPRSLPPDGNSGSSPESDDALDFAVTSRVLLVSHQPSGTPIDIVLGALPLEDEIVRGARNVEIAGVAIPLPTPESIVVMKAIARRARDIADIEGILDVHDRLDLDWIRTRLAEFDQALGRTELVDEFDRIVTRTHRPESFDHSVE